MGAGGVSIYYNITIGGEGSTGTPNLYYVINGRPLILSSMTILLLWTSDQETKGPDGRTVLNTLIIMICYDMTDDANQQIEKRFPVWAPLMDFV